MQLVGYVCLVIVSVFLILVILIQRGRGGGLVGALGGAGGSSAFGTKAGDVFTKFTIYVAVVWFAITLGLNKCTRNPSEIQLETITPAGQQFSVEEIEQGVPGGGMSVGPASDSDASSLDQSPTNPLDNPNQTGPETIDPPLPGPGSP